MGWPLCYVAWWGSAANTIWSHGDFISVKLWFSNSDMRQKDLVSLLKHRLLGPVPRMSISALLIWSPEFAFLTSSLILLVLLFLELHFGNCCQRKAMLPIYPVSSEPTFWRPLPVAGLPLQLFSAVSMLSIYAVWCLDSPHIV